MPWYWHPDTTTERRNSETNELFIGTFRSKRGDSGRRPGRRSARTRIIPKRPRLPTQRAEAEPVQIPELLGKIVTGDGIDEASAVW